MVLARTNGLMGQCIRENGDEIRSKVAAYTIGQMVENTKGLGKIINYMGRENTVGLMVDCIRANI